MPINNFVDPYRPAGVEENFEADYFGYLYELQLEEKEHDRVRLEIAGRLRCLALLAAWASFRVLVEFWQVG